MTSTLPVPPGSQVRRTPDAPVLAYMDVDLSTDLAALLPLVAPLISGHSDLAIGIPARPRLPGGPRRQAGVHLARLQPAAARHAAARFSDAQCGFKAIRADVARAAAAAGRGHRLVLRHRDAGAGRAGRAAHPRGAGGLGRRPGQPGRHRRHRAGRPARASPGSAARWAPAGFPCRAARAARPPPAAGRRRAGRPDRPAAALRRGRGRQHPGLPCALRRCCGTAPGRRRPT